MAAVDGLMANLRMLVVSRRLVYQMLQDNHSSSSGILQHPRLVMPSAATDSQTSLCR